MTRQLTDAEITHVSYVGKAANKKTFLLTKSLDGKPDFDKSVDVIIDKSDEKQLVYGVVYEPDVEDAHGDYMNADDIEKSAHKFMQIARNIDTNHDFEAGVGEVVESYIAPADFEISGQTITKGTWVMVTKASDEIWEAIKKGEITGYSMAGTAQAVEKSDNSISESDKEDSFVNKIANKVGELLTKGVVRDYYENTKRRRNVFAALNSLEHSLYDNHTTDMEKIKESANEFVEIINEISYEDLQKSLEEYNEMKQEDEGMDAEQIKEVVKAALDEGLSGVKAEVEELKKAQTEVEKGSEESEPEADIAGIVKGAVDEAIKPIQEDVEGLKKSTKSSSRIDDEEIQKENTQKSGFFDSVFLTGGQ